MIPSLETTFEGAAFLARRFGLTTPPNKALLAAALEEARQLATTPRDEPAALLYALSRRPRLFPGVYSRVTTLLVFNQARLLGYQLQADERDLWAFFPRPGRAPSFAEIQHWMTPRLLALPTGDPT